MVASTEVGAKGRLVIPAQVRAEAGIDAGQTVVVTAVGIGRIVLETPEAVQARVWAAASPADPDDDSVPDMRAVREQDNAVAEASADRRRPPATSDSNEDADVDEAGAVLLAALGL